MLDIFSYALGKKAGGGGEGGSGVIDVDALPIETCLWIRFSEDSTDASLNDLFGGDGVEFHYIVVDELPTSFEISSDEGQMYIYILRETGVPYVSFDGTTSMLLLDAMFNSQGATEGMHRGVISNTSEITEDGVYTIINDDIDGNAFYRVSGIGGAYTIFNGEKGALFDATTQVIIVDSLPTEGIPYSENFLVTIYLQLSDSATYIYYENKWQSYAEAGGDSYGGVISDESEAVDTTKAYIVYNEGGYRYYRYENGWVEYVAKDGTET